MSLFPSFKESGLLKILLIYHFKLKFSINEHFRLNGLRIFMALFLFMFYTITMSYRGSLNSILTVTLYPKPIDTVKDLSAKIEKDVSNQN